MDADPAPRTPRERTRGRSKQAIPFRDPDACLEHGRQQARVVDTIHHHGFIERTHVCDLCGERWPSYQTILHPLRAASFIKARLQRFLQDIESPEI